MATEDLVTFLDAEGNEISNDPRWFARQQQAQVAEQQANLQNDDDDLDKEPAGYADMTGPQVKKLAVDRGLDTKGLTKKSQVVALLEADDAEKAAAAGTTEAS